MVSMASIAVKNHQRVPSSHAFPTLFPGWIARSARSHSAPGWHLATSGQPPHCSTGAILHQESPSIWLHQNRAG